MTSDWHTTNCLLGVRPCRCEKIQRHNIFLSAWLRKERR